MVQSSTGYLPPVQASYLFGPRMFFCMVSGWSGVFVQCCGGFVDVVKPELAPCFGDGEAGASALVVVEGAGVVEGMEFAVVGDA